MTRVKRGVAASKRRKNVLQMAKGFRWRRKSHFRAANEALLKAGTYAHRDRRAKKRTNRRLWIVRLGNAVRQFGISYSAFIKLCKDKQIGLDRKVLSEIAAQHPETFKKFMETVK